MPQAKTSERRRLQRYALPLKVFDQDSGALLGGTDNISASGLMLISSSRIPTMVERNIVIELPQQEGSSRLELSAFTAWSSFSDSRPVYYCTRLSFYPPERQATGYYPALYQ